MMRKKKRKLSKQNLTLAIYYWVMMVAFLMAIPLWLFLLLTSDTNGLRISFGFFLIGTIWALFYLWCKREMFLGIVEIQENGIVDKCFAKRTVFVPWEEIEQVKIGWIHTGGMEHHLFLNVIRKESKTFHRSKANITNGFDYHIALDEYSIKLLKEYLPQRLKEMLGPHAFD